MKYVRQFMIIIGISFLGELLKYCIPFPIPASIYGLILLFMALELGIIKVSAVKETAKFLIEIMPLMFIPAGVGLLESWDVLQPVFLPVAVITVISTLLVMVISGKTTQAIIRKEQKKGDRNS